MVGMTIKQAAADLGVHYMTVYRYVRLGMLPATRVGSSWSIDPADLEEFRQGAPAANGARRSPADWRQRLRARMMAGDERGAWGVVEAALASGVDPADVYEKMLAPAMNEIGDEWAAGVVDVADEHRASAVATRIVGRLGPRFARRGRSKGTVVTATPAGELHGLGIAVVGDLFRGAGYDVVDLGCNVPAASLAKTVAEAPRLVAVALSAHNPDGDEVLEEAVAVARAAGVVVVVGGCAVPSEAHAQRAGADAWAPTARAAVELVEARTP